MASPEENEESDWNSSRIKGFTFGDDDDTPFEQLATYQSISENSLSQSGSGATSPADELGVSFENYSIGGGSNNQGNSRVVSDRVRAASAAYAANLDRRGVGVSNNPSISEVLSVGNDPSHPVIGGVSDPVILTSDVKTLRSELSHARKQLEKIQHARFVPLHPKETVRCIFLGQQYSLEFYKTWLDKLALIDAAIELSDGNAILAVVLFLRQTLCRSKLAEALATRPQAVRQLAVYLEKRSLFNELADLYSSLGQYHEAALILYKACLVQVGKGPLDKEIMSKIRRIKSALSTPYFSQSTDSAYLIEEINLLERTSPILAAVPSLELSSDQVENKGAGDSTLSVPTLKDPITVYDLIVCCAYHYGIEVPENLLHSIQAMKKRHKMTERQFVWAALKGRALKNNWKDCEQLVLSKGWLGGKKIKPEFLPLDVAKVLYDHGAPSEYLNVYIAMIEAPEDKEKFAKKVGAHTAVIDVYVSQRDKQALQNYQMKLVPKTEEWWYAENALNAGNTRWKN